MAMVGSIYQSTAFIVQAQEMCMDCIPPSTADAETQHSKGPLLGSVHPETLALLEQNLQTCDPLGEIHANHTWCHD